MTNMELLQAGNNKERTSSNISTPYAISYSILGQLVEQIAGFTEEGEHHGDGQSLQNHPCRFMHLIRTSSHSYLGFGGAFNLPPCRPPKEHLLIPFNRRGSSSKRYLVMPMDSPFWTPKNSISSNQQFSKLKRYHIT